VAAVDLGSGVVKIGSWVVVVGMKRVHPIFGKGRVRQDGRRTHEMSLFEVMASSESGYPPDDDRRLADTGTEQAFRLEPKGFFVMARAQGWADESRYLRPHGSQPGNAGPLL
jgi:hypothetical protein